MAVTPASSAKVGLASAKSRAARVNLCGEQGVRFASAIALSNSFASLAAANHLPSSPGVTATRSSSTSAGVHSGTPHTGDGFVAERYDPTPPASLADLRPLLGEYRSDELAATYRLWEQAGQVFFAINNAPLRPFPTTDGRARWTAKHMLWIGFGEVIFRRDARNRVTGLTVGDERVSAIPFRKVS